MADLQHKYDELLKERNRFADIINDTQEMFYRLDKYRKSKDARDLYNTHDQELIIRRKINEEIRREEHQAQQQKMKAA